MKSQNSLNEDIENYRNDLQKQQDLEFMKYQLSLERQGIFAHRFGGTPDSYLDLINTMRPDLFKTYDKEIPDFSWYYC
jgi:hypothetical protein